MSFPRFTPEEFPQLLQLMYLKTIVNEVVLRLLVEQNPGTVDALRALSENLEDMLMPYALDDEAIREARDYIGRLIGKSDKAAP